jgi:hypothetical protein
VIRGLDSGVTVFVFRNGSGEGAFDLARAVFRAHKKRAAKAA